MWLSGQQCPVCNGGASRERSASYFIDETLGQPVFFVCHRAKCGSKGSFIGSWYNPIPIDRGDERKYRRKTIQNRELIELIFDLVSDRYELSREILEFYRVSLESFEDKAIYLSIPLVSIDGTETFGFSKKLIKRYDSNARLSKAITVHFSKSSKSRNPMFRQYQSATIGKTIVIVEDCLSAIKIASLGIGVSAIALLGCSLSRDRELEIRKFFAREYGYSVIVILDPDANEKAVHLAMKNGWEWIPVRLDPKDLPRNELVELLSSRR
ncbi:MAG: hypothetical protein QW328_06995 [Nitrososphaerota archaeon]